MVSMAWWWLCKSKLVASLHIDNKFDVFWLILILSTVFWLVGRAAKCKRITIFSTHRLERFQISCSCCVIEIIKKWLVFELQGHLMWITTAPIVFIYLCLIVQSGPSSVVGIETA